MTYKALLIACCLAAMAVGCNQSEVSNVPNPNRVERKDPKNMTEQEKIDFINKTPMAPDAKDRAIARIKAGQQ